MMSIFGLAKESFISFFLLICQFCQTLFFLHVKNIFPPENFYVAWGVQNINWNNIDHAG